MLSHLGDTLSSQKLQYFSFTRAGVDIYMTETVFNYNIPMTYVPIAAVDQVYNRIFPSLSLQFDECHLFSQTTNLEIYGIT